MYLVSPHHMAKKAPLLGEMSESGLRRSGHSSWRSVWVRCVSTLYACDFVRLLISDPCPDVPIGATKVC